jgi:hypothetical protein
MKLVQKYLRILSVPQKNTIRRYYKHQSVNAVQENNGCLRCESYKIHKYKMQGYWLLKELVHIATIRL